MKQLILPFVTFMMLLVLNVPAFSQPPKGKWVISDYNERYQFGGQRAPNLMAHYKDESVIVAGWQTATGGGAASYIFINRSKDGGKTWKRIYEKNTDLAGFDFYQIAHPSPRHIIALAEKFVKDSLNKWVKQSFVMRSSDTGATWIIFNNPLIPVFFLPEEYPGSLSFSGQSGIITLTTATKNELWYSFDYGLQWQKKDLPSDLAYAHGKVMGLDKYLLGSQVTKKIAYSEDFILNGNWKYTTMPEYFNPRSLAIVSKDTFWSALAKPSGLGNTSRNYITGTTNGGQDWKVPLDVFEDNIWQRNGLTTIAFADNMRGAAVGFNVSYLTEDGGITWKKRDLSDSVAGFSVAPQSIAYYYNPLTRKSMLLTLLNLNYVLRYDFDADLTGISQVAKTGNRLRVFPNPGSGKFTIIADNTKQYQIKIFNAFGAEVFQSEINPDVSGEFEIDLSNQPKGIYFIQVVSEKESLTQRIIIQ